MRFRVVSLSRVRATDRASDKVCMPEIFEPLHNVLVGEVQVVVSDRKGPIPDALQQLRQEEMNCLGVGGATCPCVRFLIA